MMGSVTAHIVVSAADEADPRETAAVFDHCQFDPVVEKLDSALPETIGEEANGTAVLACGPAASPLSTGRLII